MTLQKSISKMNLDELDFSGTPWELDKDNLPDEEAEEEENDEENISNKDNGGCFNSILFFSVIGITVIYLILS